MQTFKLTDEKGVERTMQASDMRALAQVHFMLHGTEVVRAELIDE